jgi:hypothetical protein
VEKVRQDHLDMPSRQGQNPLEGQAMNSIKVTRRQIPGGEKGTWLTLEEMEGITREASVDPRIRQLAFRILQAADVESHDKLGEVTALYEWVRDSLDFRKDPRGFELLTHPVVTLQMGAGDCDDRTVMLGALLRSVGFPTRFNVSSNLPGLRPSFRHVFLQTQIPGGRWITLDPTTYLRAGEVYPGTTRVARPASGGRFVEMAQGLGLIPCGRVRIPLRMIEDGTALEMGLSLEGDDTITVYPGFGSYASDEELAGFFKSLFKKVKSVVTAPVKAVAKVVSTAGSVVSKIPIVGKVASAALPFAASIIPGVGPVAALAMKGAGAVSAVQKLIPSGAQPLITEAARRAFMTASAPATTAPVPVTTPTFAPAAPAATAAPTVAPAAPTVVPARAVAVAPVAAPSVMAPAAAATLIPGVSNKTLLLGLVAVLLLPRLLPGGR